MSDCIFCSLADGTIATELLHDDGLVVAFRDMAPKASVHLLVIPKQHYVNVSEVAAADPGLVGQLVSVAHELAAAEGVQDGYRLIFNTGAKGGQTVFHAHLHLLAGAAMPGF